METQRLTDDELRALRADARPFVALGRTSGENMGRAIEELMAYRDTERGVPA